MRSWCLALLLPLLVGCADVEQSLVWLEDGRIAWRWQAAPTTEHTLDLAALTAAVVPEGQDVVRSWVDNTDERTWYVVQARVDGPEAWSTFRAALLARVQDVAGVIPAAWAPPTLSREEGAWAIDHPAGAPTGSTSSLTLRAPRLRAEGGEWGDGGAVRYRHDTPVHVTVMDPAPHPMGFILNGGPALLFALAGMGMLMWVNRRSAKRLRAERR